MSDQNSKKRRRKRKKRQAELLDAVNAYLLAQNSYGYKDRGDRTYAARTRLCRAAYALNAKESK